MTEWFYRLDGVNQGPVSEADLKHIFDSGALPLTTAVWQEGMEDWIEAGKIETFCAQSIAIPAITIPTQKTSKPACTSFLTTQRIALFVCVCVAGFGLWLIKNEMAKTARHAGYENYEPGETASPSAQSSTASPYINIASTPDTPPENTPNQIMKMPAGAQDKSRASDEQAHEKYLKAATENDKPAIYALFETVSSKKLTPIDVNAIADPVQGDLGKVREIIQYLGEKLKVDTSNNWHIRSFEVGFIGRSDLWVYRQIQGSRDRPMIETEIFLLRDLDPTSASIITKTDRNSGQQIFNVRFKCLNNRKRVVCVNRVFYVEAYVSNEVQLRCADEDDAKRAGKALAALIVAYGGKAELIDSTDSF